MGSVASERLLDVADMPLLVRTSAPDSTARSADMALLTKVLGEGHANPSLAKTAVTLTLGHAEPEVPRQTPDFEGPYGDHWFRDGVGHFRHHWGLSAIITPTEVVMGGPAEGYRRWVAVRNSMLFVLAHLYMGQGRFLLHSAALHREAAQSSAAATLLVIGDSGRGKSTLTYAGLRAGMCVMADDMVVVTPTTDRLVAQGVPRVVAVPSDVLPEPPDATDILPGDDRGRVELHSCDLHSGAEAITLVVLCDHDAGSGQLSPAESTDTVEHLASAFVLSALTEPMRRWFPVAMRLANGPTVRFLHDSDPDTRVARAAEMLHQLTGVARET